MKTKVTIDEDDETGVLTFNDRDIRDGDDVVEVPNDMLDRWQIAFADFAKVQQELRSWRDMARRNDNTASTMAALNLSDEQWDRLPDSVQEALIKAHS